MIRSGERDRSLYTRLLDNAFDRALALDGKASAATLAMTGMSGRSYRTLINNLVASVPDARYLEIGSWMGSTACAVMDGNAVRIVCIDNWSQFDGPKDAFLANTAACISAHVRFSFIESDFRKVDYAGIGRFNIYLFDGPHSPQDHFDGVAMPLVALDHEFVFIVDDWNWEGVRYGTLQALRAAGLRVLYSIEIRTTQDGTHAALAQQASDWHNGYFIAVLRQAH
ncbi:hypothetical protein [Lichenicoccus sp.]|uniref:hypothetical protein n=1 Tax=Lichenicoccus sp. TaxID=2781899 RepID=UPI003D118574